MGEEKKKIRQCLANYLQENHDSERNQENIPDPNIQLSHLNEAIQLRFITEFPGTLPLTSLVCKNQYHLTVRSLEKNIIICRQKNVTGLLCKESVNSFGSLSF